MMDMSFTTQIEISCIGMMQQHLNGMLSNFPQLRVPRVARQQLPLQLLRLQRVQVRLRRRLRQQQRLVQHQVQVQPQ